MKTKVKQRKGRDRDRAATQDRVTADKKLGTDSALLHRIRNVQLWGPDSKRRMKEDIKWYQAN